MPRIREYVTYITYAISRLCHLERGMERAMRDLAILGAVWLGMFFALSRAVRYPAVWAALGASAMTGLIGIYVFWLDWSPPLH